MATQVQFRGGNTNDNENFTGAEREVTVDTGKQTLVVHNGTEEGGFPLLRAEDGAQDFSTTGNVSAVDGTFTGDISAVDGTFTGATTLTGDLTINTDALFVDASEKKVMVGTTNAGTNGTADDLVVANNGSASDQAGITIRGGTTGRSQIFFADGTSGDAEYAGMLRYDHNEDAMMFRTAATEAMQINSSQSLLIGPSAGATTTITSGGAATFAGVVKADAGIDFSGISSTADSGSVGNNLLDDYEEGTFTPTLTKWNVGTPTPMSCTHTTQQGRYIKIGAVVHARINLFVDAGITWGNSSSALTVDGLPFTYGTNNTVIYKGFFRYQKTAGDPPTLTNYYPTDFEWYGYGTKVYGVTPSTGSNWDETYDGFTQVVIEFTYTTLSH